MKFVFIADIHLSRYSQDKIESETNLPERLNSIKNALHEVAMYCINNGIKHLIIGGDILHGKSIIYAIAQEIMLQFFQEYGHAIKFWVIDGNHDLSGKGQTVVSALRPLENINEVNWIRFNQTYHLKSADILFVPYSYNLPQIVKDHKAKILISHFGLNEGVLNSGLSIISDIGMKELVGRYELVLLGHYHKPQELITKDISIYYAGSPIQLDWGEKDDEKRFLVVDTDSMDIQSIPFTKYKKFIELELKASNVEDVLKAVKDAKDAGNHIKVIMKEKVDLSGIECDFNIIDKTEYDITDRGITSSMSQNDKFRQYMNIKKLPEDKIEIYLQVAKEIVDEIEV